MLLVDFTHWKIDTEKLFLCEYNTFASKKSLNEPMAIVYIESSNWIETNQIKLAFLLTTASCATQIYLGWLLLQLLWLKIARNFFETNLKRKKQLQLSRYMSSLISVIKKFLSSLITAKRAKRNLNWWIDKFFVCNNETRARIYTKAVIII